MWSRADTIWSRADTIWFHVDTIWSHVETDDPILEPELRVVGLQPPRDPGPESVGDSLASRPDSLG